jgi:tetratricopeptide (TPR) repeat protein
MKRDVGLWCLAAAVLLAIFIYAPALRYGLVGYDDTTLLHDNWIVQEPSWASLRTIFGALDVTGRLTLAPEYLPIRDLSVMLDYAVWGDWYAGHHLTNLVLYIAALVAWFFALDGFGIDRRIVGITILLWAVQPAHAESVAWLAERKGLLAAAFAGLSAIGFARFRMGRHWLWLFLATVTAVAAIWSKAHGAFAIGAFAALELFLPTNRVSWKRSLIGLATIGVASLAAFVPVLILARSAEVVGGGGSKLGLALAVHGHYLKLASLLVTSSVSYPIGSALDRIVGACGLVAIVAVLLPSRYAPASAIRAGAAFWFLTWLPVSHLILPLQMVVVADRYLLLPSLGFALVAATLLSRISITWARNALIAALVIASTARAIDARSNWQSGMQLWQRAVATNPADAEAWSAYANAIAEAGDPQLAERITQEGLEHGRSPKLVLRQALLVLARGDRANGLALMREAANGGEFRSMTNLALLLSQDGNTAEALDWARRSVVLAPLYANGQRVLGKLALEANNANEALTAFERAYTLEPHNLTNRYNLALALLRLGRADEARAHLEACLADPTLAPRARPLLGQ